MTRFEYIAALRSALEGLPPDVIERTVAACEQRIHDASAAGQSEDDILASLEDPQKVAADLHAAHAPKLPAVVTAPQAHTTTPARGPASALRMFFSLIGLMVFNLFLIGPAIAYAGLLIAAFAISLTCYLGGVAVTGASLTGINQVSLAGPLKHVSFDEPDEVADMHHHDGRTRVNIGEAGVHVETGSTRVHVVPASLAVTQASTVPASATDAASKTGTGDDTVVDIGPKGVVVKDDGGRDVFVDDDDDNTDVDMPGLHFHRRDAGFDHNIVSLGTDFISESQPVQVGVGIGIIFAGIISFLLCLAILRYTLLGVVKLAQLELGVLRGA